MKSKIIAIITALLLVGCQLPAPDTPDGGEEPPEETQPKPTPPPEQPTEPSGPDQPIEPNGSVELENPDLLNHPKPQGQPDEQVNGLDLYKLSFAEYKAGGDFSDHYVLRRGEALSIRLPMENGSISLDEGKLGMVRMTEGRAGKWDPSSGKMVVVSDKPGRFSPVHDKRCKNVGGVTGSGLRVKVPPMKENGQEREDVGIVTCPLDPDKTYYVNIRNAKEDSGNGQAEDSCEEENGCSFFLQLDTLR